jgi:protein TonB
MPPPTRPVFLSKRLACWALGGLLWAGQPALAQFATPPQAQRPASMPVSLAPNAKAYRLDAAQHIYAAYRPHILKGMVPPLVYAIVVTETEVDARGAVLQVRVVRAPAEAKEVTPWVVSLIRRAAPLPAPVRIGRVKFIEVWLVDKSGQFQVHTLTEGQR